jgi:PAS domain S-box-containing protein
MAPHRVTPRSVQTGEPVVHAADLLERMTDGFIALDRDWRIVYMNAAARERTGEAIPASAVGRSHWEQWPDTLGTEVERQYRAAMATQKPVHFEHHYSRPGVDFWHSIDVYPDAHGLSIFYRDITARKRADDLAQLLAAASTRFVSTLDQTAMLRVVSQLAVPMIGDWAAIYLVDEGSRVTAAYTVAVDERKRAILKQVMGQLPAVPVDETLPWNRAMRRHEPVLLVNPGEEFYSALGSPEARDFVQALDPISILAVPLMARERSIGGITFGRSRDTRAHDEFDVLAAQEIALPAGLALDTARLYEMQRQATHDAEDARRRAEEANLSKADFLRAMSHELRTPLNAIGGYVQLLRMGARGELAPAVARDLERIERNQHHLTRMINDVLHFARLDAGRVQFQFKATSVKVLLDQLEDFVSPQVDAEGRPITIRPPSSDVLVWADEDKARQILVNLVSNAMKHTPSSATIEVYVEQVDTRAGGGVRICVRDNGPGIPAEKLESIFEPFVQVGRTLNHPVEGLGLGLAIARDLARGMEGDLTVRSELGQGAAFTLELRRSS